MEIVYKSNIPRSFKLKLNESIQFYKVLQVKEIFEIFENNLQATFMIHGGNTAHGKFFTNSIIDKKKHNYQNL